MVESFFIGLTLIILIALVTSIVMRWLKQPSIISYILTGIIVSPFLIDLIGSKESFEPFAKIGIALLLFTVGLNLNPRSIKSVGKVSIVVGLGQLIFTFIAGYVISVLLGFSILAGIYIGIALAFSSTIVILKFLADKEETETLHGRIAIGFLIVQDLVHIIAIIVLITVASIPFGASVGSVAIATVFKALLLSIGLVVAAKYILPPITKRLARSQEMLLFFAVGWAFTLALLFDYLNFSLEIGALIAGVTLAISPFKYEISSKLKPIRDFFLLIFFIWLALQMGPLSLKMHLAPTIIFSLVVLIGTPIIVMSLMGLLGYTRRNSFLTGLYVSQISEFSFIIVALGVQLGHISSDILSLIILVGLATIAGSSYFITHSYSLYHFLSGPLKIFERKHRRKVDEGKYHVREDYDVILFGYNRIGYDLMKAFNSIKKKFLVVDYNPDTTLKLAKKGIDCRYGDANDLELLEHLNLKKAKMIISTIPEKATNLILLNKLKDVNKDATFIVIAHHVDDSVELYRAGATYVIMPHFLGGKHTANLIRKFGLKKSLFMGERKRTLDELRKRMREGHKHPSHERG